MIGDPRTARRDNGPKTDGSAVYAMDLHLENQAVAVMLRSPRFGGTLVFFDDSAASDMPGFVRAAALPTRTAVVVYGENTWAALQARDAMGAEWDFSRADNRGSERIKADLLAAVNGDAEFDAKGSAAVTAELLDGAAQVIERDFFFPYLAHATVEPLTCTIAPTENGVTLHDGCQMQTAAQMAVAAVLQVPHENVEVTTLYAGGTFGRRSTQTADYHVEAALAFALAGGRSSWSGPARMTSGAGTTGPPWRTRCASAWTNTGGLSAGTIACQASRSSRAGRWMRSSCRTGSIPPPSKGCMTRPTTFPVTMSA